MKEIIKIEIIVEEFTYYVTIHLRDGKEETRVFKDGLKLGEFIRNQSLYMEEKK